MPTAFNISSTRSRRSVGGPILHHDERVLDVFKSGQHGDEVEVLKDETDMFAAKRRGLLPLQLRNVHPRHSDLSAGRPVEAADEIEQRGLAAARGTDKGEEGARLDVEADVL